MLFLTLKNSWLGLVVVGSLLGQAGAEPTNIKAAISKIENSAVCASDTKADILKCEQLQAGVYETYLNSSYQKAAALVTKKGGNKAYRTLVDAQRMWVQFREKNCSVFKLTYQGGDFSEMTYIGCKSDYAKDRAEQLDSMFDQLNR